MDPYLEFVRQTLDRHPGLRAPRIYQMVRERGYPGSVVQLRRAVVHLRPPEQEPFLRLHTFPAEQGQVDWANFGQVRAGRLQALEGPVMVGRARRKLSCFVIALSYSRALYLEFFFDQTMENFLRGHVHAFHDWAGQPRVILYDNLRSADPEAKNRADLIGG
jgi:transposase